MLSKKKEMYFIPEILGILITFLIALLVLDDAGFWEIIQIAFIVNIPIQVLSFIFKPKIKNSNDAEERLFYVYEGYKL